MIHALFGFAASRIVKLISLSLVSFLSIGVSACVNNINPDTLDAEVMTAIDEHDFDRLISLLDKNRLPPETTQLATGITASMLGEDQKAAGLLSSLAKDTADMKIKARALRSLSGVMVRQGRYNDAAKAMSEIRAMSDADGVTIDDQSYAFFTAMSPVPRMEVVPVANGKTSVLRDKADLARIEISVNGVSDFAVFDTGAAFSTLTVSTAQKMGLQNLGAAVDVGGSTNVTVQSGIAVADRLEVGGFVFKNVPFIIVPDESMSFPEQDYYVTSILGLPVIRALGRIVWERSVDGESVSFSSQPVAPDPKNANMITSGWEHVVLARVNESRNRLRFFLDSGARKSSFFRSASVAVPTLLEGAEESTRSVGGLGGVIEEQNVTVIPAYEMTLGETKFEAGPVSMSRDNGSFRHGVIGQDILSSFKRVEMDFNAMALSVSQ